MGIIKYIRIESLWGCKDISMSFLEDLNFIIGENGAGKTTVVTLLSSVISVNIENLFSIDYRNVVVAISGGISIRVLKGDDQDGSYIMIDVSSGENSSVHKINDGDAESIKHRKATMIRSIIDAAVTINWLPITRKSSPTRFDPFTTPSFPSTIDEKLDDIKNGLFKVFSKQVQTFNVRTKLFQRNVLYKLLDVPDKDEILLYQNDLNIDQEKELISEIFSVMFGSIGPDSDERIARYYDTLKRALSNPINNSANDFGVIFNAWRTRSIIGDYEELKKRKNDIFKSRSEFLEVLNQIFPAEKEFFVSAKNELSVKVRNKLIPLSSLSSGEKQMLILLGQAFLQERKRIVYIADEPEISLHITWQDKIADSIRIINDKAQLIFATHSPDIVGRNALNVIKLK